MKVKLIYQGDGFEATKIIDMPALPHHGMDIGIVLDDGVSQPGTEWFTVHKVAYHLNQAIFILRLTTPLKYGKYESDSTSKLGVKDFNNEDWEIRKDPRIKPFKE